MTNDENVLFNEIASIMRDIVTGEIKELESKEN